MYTKLKRKLYSVLNALVIDVQREKYDIFSIKLKAIKYLFSSNKFCSYLSPVERDGDKGQN